MLIDSQNKIFQIIKDLFIFERSERNDKIKRKNEKIIVFEKNVFENDDVESDDVENDDFRNDDFENDDLKDDDFEKRHNLLIIECSSFQALEKFSDVENFSRCEIVCLFRLNKMIERRF